MSDRECSALDVPAGLITCGSVERRRIIEEAGVGERVVYIGDAEAVGRQGGDSDEQ